MARLLSKRQKHLCRDCYDFVPHPHFERRVPNAKVIFVTFKGDLFCEAVPSEWITKVLELGPMQHPDKTFLFCTKNPGRYSEFLDFFTPNCLLGTTIETNRDELVKPLTNAPLPSARYEAMVQLDWPRKFLSNEPIMDFDLDVLLGWIADINPEVCEIGYDNYGFKLKEPPLSKTLELIRGKRRLGIDTREKEIRKAWWEL